MASDFNQHAVVVLDRFVARKGGAHLESFVDSVNNYDNGNVCFAGESVSGEFMALQVEVPATATLATKSLCLMATPEVVYWETMNLRNFYNKAGEAIRGIHLVEGDIFQVSQSMITNTPAVGNYVAPANGVTKLAASTALPSTKFVGEIVDTFDFGAYREPMFVIRVRQN